MYLALHRWAVEGYGARLERASVEPQRGPPSPGHNDTAEFLASIESTMRRPITRRGNPLPTLVLDLLTSPVALDAALRSDTGPASAVRDENGSLVAARRLKTRRTN